MKKMPPNGKSSLKGTSKEELLEILLSARGEPLGLLLKSNDPAAARMKLYQVRASAGDDSLAALQIRMSPFPEGDLLIVNRQIRIAGATEDPAEGTEVEGL